MADFDSRLQFREWDDYDLYTDATLDKYALDVEAERQALVMQKWLELLTQAQAELSKTKEKLAYIEAKLFLQVKTEGVSKLGSKPTEATVKAWVRTQPEYRKLLRAKRKAENNVQYLQNARTVLEHKKACLKIESDLWICGFFARPNVVPQVDEEAKQQCKDKIQESLSKRRLRRNRKE